MKCMSNEILSQLFFALLLFFEALDLCFDSAGRRRTGSHEGVDGVLDLEFVGNHGLNVDLALGYQVYGQREGIASFEYRDETW